MAGAYSLELRERVLEAVAAGAPLAEAAARFRVSVASIVRWSALERRQGSARPKPFAGGRRPHRTEAARGAILALLEETPGLSTEALRKALAERGLAFGYGSLYRFRRRHGVLPGTAAAEEPVEALRNAVHALLRGNPGLSTEALRSALAERGTVIGYGPLYRFLCREGLKGPRNRAGARACPADLRERVLAAVADGLSVSAAARRFGVHRTSIFRWLARRRRGAAA